MTRDDTVATTLNSLFESERYDEALDYCEVASRWCEPCCQKFCGREYYIRSQYERSRVWFERLAQGGDPEGWFGLARTYLAERDPERALPYLREAADKGYGRANQWIGYAYEFGVGVQRDESLALEWYRKGARYGFLAARHGTIRMEARVNILMRAFAYPRLTLLAIKAACIFIRRMDDQRLIDVAVIPNSDAGYFRIDSHGKVR